MARLPNVDGPTVTGTLRAQRTQIRKAGTASPFDGTGISVDAFGNMTIPGTLTAGAVSGPGASGGVSSTYVDNGDASTLASAKSYADSGDSNTLASAKSYTDSAVAQYGLEAPYAALTIPAATVTAVPWGSPTENTGGYVVSGANITVPSGKGGVYAISVTLSTANSQPTRAFINLYSGSSRLACREVFTGDNTCTATVTARVADLGIIKAEIYCATATSLSGGWVTAYRLHS